VSEGAIDLQAAAERLGVHYQTAYRWVRSGRLPARKVKGVYSLDPTAVDREAARRARPQAPPARRPRGGMAVLSERALDYLLEGEERALRRLLSELADSGVPLTQTTQGVLVPALRRIGERWSAGGVNILFEHRASAIVERLLAERPPSARGRRRGTAAVASLHGDRHGLPTLMAALALREDSWTVHHLGAEVPEAQFERFCLEHRVDLAVITVTLEDTRTAAEDTAAALRDHGVRVLVGEPGRGLHELQALARGR
jgi:excisionase family DNA binding protein